MQEKYRVKDLKSGFYGFVIDKLPPNEKTIKLGQTAELTTTELFDEIEEIRGKRPPLAPEAFGIEFQGVTPDEQTFPQSFGHSPLPASLTSQQQTIPLQDVEAGHPGTSEAEMAPEVGVESRRQPGDIEHRGEELDVAREDFRGARDTATAPEGIEVGASQPGVAPTGEGGAVGGEDVVAEMGAEASDTGLPVPEGRVPGESDPTAISQGMEGGIGTGTGVRDIVRESVHKSPSIEVNYTDWGAPEQRVRRESGPDPPDNTPTSLSEKMREWAEERQVKLYTFSPQTGKVTLERLGAPGRKIAETLKLIRNNGDRATGQGRGVMDRYFGAWTKFVRGYAKTQKIPLDTAARELGRILIEHHEGRSKTGVPPIMEDIAQAFRAEFNERIAVPLLKDNQNILRQGSCLICRLILWIKGF